MAKTNSTEPKKQARIQAAHQRFNWIHDEAINFPGADLASITQDISGGIKTCLELIEMSDLDRSHNETADPGREIPPTLSISDTHALLRLAIATNALLNQHAGHRIDWINKHGEKSLRDRGFTGDLAKSPYA